MNTLSFHTPFTGDSLYFLSTCIVTVNTVLDMTIYTYPRRLFILFSYTCWTWYTLIRSVGKSFVVKWYRYVSFYLLAYTPILLHTYPLPIIRFLTITSIYSGWGVKKLKCIYEMVLIPHVRCWFLSYLSLDLACSPTCLYL